MISALCLARRVAIVFEIYAEVSGARIRFAMRSVGLAISEYSNIYSER
jgi:hypothetical protein